MSHTPVGGHPQGWEHKLADRSSLPPAPGEEKTKAPPKHVFLQPQLAKQGREETEGSSGSSARTPPSGEGPSPSAPAPAPAYLRWARSLHDLLEDAEGVRLFRKFVGGAGGLHVDRLNFYFAVQGLRHEADPRKTRQVVHAIYKFLRKSQLAMPEELRAHVKRSLNDGSHIDKTVFDEMEHEVTCAITETTYQAFLRSDAFVGYVSSSSGAPAQPQPLSSPARSPPPPLPSKEALVPGARELATLHEGEELCTGAASGAGARLTHDLLMATQNRRLQPDMTSGVYARKYGVSVYGAGVHPHLAYAPYCPASRQDSDRASMSSGRTDSDAISMSGSSLDGGSKSRGGRERDRTRSRFPGMDRYINKDTDCNMMIPRTFRMQSEQLRMLSPLEFAQVLTDKLERVKRDQDSKEKLDRKLMEGEGEEVSGAAIPPQMVAAAIREKLQVDDDNDQDILDQHVSRVWSESTPGGSPPGRRRHAHGHPRRRPPSTTSADSGLYDAPAHSHTHSLSRRSGSKNTVYAMTDSGVSVVSEGTSASGPAVAPRVLMWIAEGTERHHAHASGCGSSGGVGRRSYLSSRASSVERRRDGDMMPPLQPPHVPTQLDEARRRLQMHPPARASRSGAKAAAGSGASSSSGAGGEQPCTVLVLSFLDEPVPYRIKVPHAPLTLRTFKEYLPRKGNYRYFFKTECPELDNAVIQEEVSNDNEMLPVFEGKVMARVKSME